MNTAQMTGIIIASINSSNAISNSMKTGNSEADTLILISLIALLLLVIVLAFIW